MDTHNVVEMLALEGSKIFDFRKVDRNDDCNVVSKC